MVGLAVKVSIARDVGRTQSVRVRGRRACVFREVEADGDITERSDRQVDWIADDDHPRRHRDRLATAEGQGAIRASDDAESLSRDAMWAGANLDRGAVERVGQLHLRTDVRRCSSGGSSELSDW